jgi:DNA-binding XRE family transcriptional regulator
MKTKRIKRFIYEGLGFPVVLVDVSLVKKRDIWTPAVDYNKLQKSVLLVLTQKPIALTGNEIHFIRTYFEMTLENFGKHFGVTHAAVLAWEKMDDKLAKINPTTELCIRLFILEKLNMSNQVFREAFREFDIENLIKASKTSSNKIRKPLMLPSENTFRKTARGKRDCFR